MATWDEIVNASAPELEETLGIPDLSQMNLVEKIDFLMVAMIKLQRS